MISHLTNMRCRATYILAVILFATTQVNAQEGDTSVSNLSVDKYLQIVSGKSNRIVNRIDKSSAKVLRRFQRLERKIEKQVSGTYSQKPNDIFRGMEEQYNRLSQDITNQKTLQQYIPAFDTLNTSLNFLNQNITSLPVAGKTKQKLKEALSNVKNLEGRLQKAENIKKFLKQRKEYLKSQFSSSGLTKDLKKINKEYYYYGAQIQEYKSLLKDHKKAEQKALELLSKTKLFRDFMRKNSMLASLFRLPDPNQPVAAANLSGLQTRTQVNGLIQQQIAAGGPGAQQTFSQNIQAAQSEISQMKDKLLKAYITSSDEEIPDFKPNSQKTRSFWKRIELGTNIQTQKPNGYFPVTSDLGLSIGYKLNDRSVIGVGGSYRIGWGKNISHIRISHQGIGLRSFVDWKIKGSFWFSGGYEMNYRREFNRIEELKEYAAWQQSGLIGVSKQISLKTKFFKKSTLKLLWDVLSYQQTPRTKAILFRVGYNF